MSTAERDAVLAANASFYAAFDHRDIAAMEAMWSSESDVACVHPGWPPIRGREAVLQSWRAIFDNSKGEAPSCDGPTCHIHGDAAYVLCRERLGNMVLIATNLFSRQPNGAWVLVHHHSSALARVPQTPPLDPDLLPN